MKNIIKKMFSLLLVGVVAVSMFGFIAPNRVDATEANRLEGSVLVKTQCSENAYPISVTIEFFVDFERRITAPKYTRLDGKRGESIGVKIPREARIVKVNVINLKNIKPYKLNTTFTFTTEKFTPTPGYSIIVSANFPRPDDFPRYNTSHISDWVSLDPIEKLIKR